MRDAFATAARWLDEAQAFALATLVEEPVAAAYEVMLSGMVSDGRVLVVDMGGGTLDAAVIRISTVLIPPATSSGTRQPPTSPRRMPLTSPGPKAVT